MRRLVPYVLMSLIVMMSTPAGAQEKSTPAKSVPTLLRVDLVFVRLQGEKKTASVPYTLAISADRSPTRLRMGAQIPVRYERTDEKGGSASVAYRDVGNNIDCTAEPVEDSRFKLTCSLEVSSVYTMEERKTAGDLAATAATPAFKRFMAEASLVLRDGQTAQYTMATDPVTGEVTKVDVTLHVVK